MEIFPSGSRASRKMPENYFTGTVWLDPIVEAPAPATLRTQHVSFEPGARTAWHTHPLGQALYVVSGVGRCQVAGGPVTEIRAGDSVWFGPNERHWHGASPTVGMVHIATQEGLDGVNVEWAEHVTDEQYEGR